MDRVISFRGIATQPAEIGTPGRITRGAPQTQTRNLFEGENGRLHCGRWSASEGAWQVRYDEWEYCTILSGRGALISEDGSRMEFAAGDSFIIEPGFTGIFDVIEPVTKDYVILLP